MKRSGNSPFEFIYRNDLHVLPDSVQSHEVKLHGGFAADRRAGYGQLYYAMPESGIVRIDEDLERQALIPLPEKYRSMNYHSTKIGKIGGNWRLFLPANNDAQVAVFSLEGEVDFVLPKPEFEQYREDDVSFAPTDTVLVGEQLFIADGYGANYISSLDVIQKKWTGIFGGKTDDPKEDGRFTTAHGINVHFAEQNHLVITDRPNSRIQIHTLGGEFVNARALPQGSWPCGIDFIQWEGRWLGVVGSLVDPVQDRPAPIFIVDASDFKVLSTIRPKEELSIEAAQHLHNVIWHVVQGQLFLVCQSWNPGFYFVLEKI